RISAELIDSEYKGEEKVILQGAVDCAFIEKGKLYIVDFKTDRINNSEELANLYGIQLKLYAKALENIKKIPVGGCYLYSFHQNKEILIK
ncbi:MAG: PD-(D/E)XK nuclease family protein, partial [Clostridia bacterium]